MGRQLHLLMLGFCVLGFAGGFAAKRGVTEARPDSAAAEGPDLVRDQRKSRDRVGGRGSERERGSSVSPATPTLRSSDSLEDLLSVGDDSLYPRLALWLLDAGEEDIAAFWDAYSKREKRRREVTDLILVNWTRLNPRAAIAAVQGTGDEAAAWKAWACNDPEASLTACLAQRPEVLDSVARGIGEFRPEWLMEHLDRIPEERRHVALRGLAEGNGGDDPLAMLDLLKTHRALLFPGLVRTAVQRDPWAAVEWFEKNGGRVVNRSVMVEPHHDLLNEMLAEHHPEVLEALVAREPAGARRRSMEEALFVRRLETDLEGAIEEARATRGPRVAMERLAMVGTRLALSNPERAFEIAEDIAALDYNPFHVDTWVRYPGGGSGSGDGDTAAFEEFLEALALRDPERLMQAGAEARPEEESARNWERSIGSRWADVDLQGYAEWVAAEGAGEELDFHLRVVANRLRGQDRFGEAAEWAMSIADETRRADILAYTVQGWVRRDPQRAVRWMEEAPLTEAERERCEKYLPAGQEGGTP